VDNLTNAELAVGELAYFPTMSTPLDRISQLALAGGMGAAGAFLGRLEGIPNSVIVGVGAVLIAFWIATPTLRSWAHAQAFWTPTKRWVLLKVSSEGDAMIFSRGEASEVQVGRSMYGGRSQQPVRTEVRLEIIDAIESLARNGFLEPYSGNSCYQITKEGKRRANLDLGKEIKIQAMVDREWARL
jgi:hypothetical protein